jgi:hypothetical protein
MGTQLRAVLMLLSLVLVGTSCSGSASGTGSSPTSRFPRFGLSAAPAIEQGVPVSDEQPIPHHGALQTAYGHEPLVGRPSYVVDAGFDAVFVYDSGRRRMLGPALEVYDLEWKPRVTPGYPFPVTAFADGGYPVDACLSGRYLAMAGGSSGRVVVMALENGLPRSSHAIDLPVVTVEVPRAVGGGRHPNNYLGPHPNISKVLCRPDGSLVAFSAGPVVSVAYTVRRDLSGVAGYVQVPHADVVDAVPIGDDAAVATVDGALLDLDSNLRTRWEAHLPGRPIALSGDGDRFAVRITQPDAVQVVSSSGRPLSGLIAVDDHSGPILLTDRVLYAGDQVADLPDGGSVQEFDAVGRAISRPRMCRGNLRSLAFDGDQLLATCRWVPSWFAVADAVGNSGPIASSYGGGDPVAVLASSG